MERITSAATAEVIGYALEYLPSGLRNFASFDLLTEDPLFVGLHEDENTDDGRSYRDQAHVCYPHHVKDRSVTIVMPRGNDQIVTALHELGHVIDWHAGQRSTEWPVFTPVTDYAIADRREAFAEAFVAWLYDPEYLEVLGWPYLFDPRSRAWFDEFTAA